MANVWLPCEPLVKSHSKIWVSWLPPIIYVAVYMMTSYICRSLHIAELTKCVNILFVTPSGLETSCFFQLDVLLEARLVQDTLVCDPMSSRFVPVLLLFGFSYWLGCYLYLRSCQIVWHSPVCHSPYPHSLPRCCNSLNVLVIQLFDKSPYHQSLPWCCNSLNVPVIQLFDKSPSFWSSLSRFVEVASVCLENLARIYSIFMAGCA